MQTDDTSPYVWTKEHIINILTQGRKPILRDPIAVKAFREVDRVDFVPAQYAKDAYMDKELDFGFGQRINSPVLVAEMITALELKPGDKVLDLGTGTGYALALMAKIVGEQGYVFSLERNQQIADIARGNLAKYHLNNCEVIFKDGIAGLVARSPYDAIHVSFAYDNLPEEVLKQLKIGGRLVTPFTSMDIKLFTRISADEFSEKIISAKDIGKVQFGVE